MLDPKPRDFTAAPDLDRAAVLRAVTEGRPGTAMRSFSALISPDEMRDVAAFVVDRLVACKDDNTDYHTEANGWPNHRQRYRIAFPFATGAIAADADEAIMDRETRDGLALFRSACISCHDGRISVDRNKVAITEGGAEPPATTTTEHADSYDTPTIHDIAPDIADLSAAERRGRDLYATACAQCHAADGTGLNWIGKFLRPGPPDFTAPDFAARFDAATLAATILEAPEGTSMPSFRSVLTVDMADDIAAYIRRSFVEP